MIPEDIFDSYYDFIEELHNNKVISREVTLVYQTRQNCPNCVHGYPNKYNNTGPSPFSFGPCPYCGGVNYIEDKKEEVIRLRAYFNRKDFLKVNNTIVEDASAQIIFERELIHKIKKSTYFVMFSDMDYGDQRFVLASEPTPFGFGSVQFSAFIKKA